MSEERRRAKEFAEELGRIYGEGLVTALLYGSAARGEFRAGSSDLNLLVVLKELGLPQLRQAAKETRAWVAEGNPPPLLMSESEWRESADVFPLEYSDIRDSYVVLAGRDLVAEMRIKRGDLRLQLEHELRSKKIQLREGILVAAESPEELGQLLVRSLSTFLVLFRGVLRLDGEAPPSTASDVIEAVAARAGFSAEPLLEVSRVRSKGAPFTPSVDDPVVAGYLEAVERTVAWLDGAELPPDLEDET
ncbi:MAG: hypothetical protein GEU90_03630 [Gemmatimonas sp.]|nr:hypothetical protein [Gemmatimonas sp.]